MFLETSARGAGSVRPLHAWFVRFSLVLSGIRSEGFYQSEEMRHAIAQRVRKRSGARNTFASLRSLVWERGSRAERLRSVMLGNY